MRTFIVLLQKEFLQIRRNSFLPRLIIAFPILIMLIMPLIMTMDVRNVNVAVVDLDRSTTSQRIASIYQRAGTIFDITWKNLGRFSIGNSMPDSISIGIIMTTADISRATTCVCAMVDTSNPSESDKIK